MKNLISLIAAFITASFGLCISSAAAVYTQPNDTVIDGRKCFMVKTAAEAGRKSGLLPKYQGDKNTKYDLCYKVVKHPYVFEDDNTVALPGEFVISTSGRSVGTLSDTLMLPCYGQNRLSATEFKNPAPYRFMRIDDYTRADSCKINEVLIGYGYPLAGNYSHFDSILVKFGPAFNDSMCPMFSDTKLIKTDIPIWNYIGNKPYSVKLPNTIKSIPEEAFKNVYIDGLVLPNSLIRIEAQAFENSFMSGDPLKIPTSVKTIEKKAFFKYRSDASIIIKGTIDEIKESAFERAQTDNGIDLDKMPKIIEKKAFYKANESVSPYNGRVYINLGNTGPIEPMTIGDSAFMDARGYIASTSIYSMRVKKIGNDAFNSPGIYLDDLQFSSFVDSIGERAFANTNSNSKIEFPEGKDIHIGKSAFSEIKGHFSLNFYDGITHIPDSICFNSSLDSWPYITFISCYSLKSIGNSAFKNCMRIQGTLYENLDSIGDYAFSNILLWISCKFTHIPQYIGTGVCSGSSIRNFDLPKGGFTEIPDYLFYRCEWFDISSLENIKTMLSYYDIKKIGKSAFAYVDALNALELPSALVEIADSAFYNSGITNLISIKQKRRLKKIGNYALAKNLFSDVYLPDSVTHVGKGVFEGCDNLGYVSFPKDMQQMDCDRMFDGCIKLRQIIFNFENPEIMQNMQDLFGDRTASDTEYHSPVIIHVPYGCLSKFSELQRLFDFVIVKEMNPDGSTSVDDVITDSTTLRLDAAMCLPDAEGLPVTVYATDGRTLFSSAAYHGEPLPLVRNNLYIIRVNNRTAKLIP